MEIERHVSKDLPKVKKSSVRCAKRKALTFPKLMRWNVLKRMSRMQSVSLARKKLLKIFKPKRLRYRHDGQLNMKKIEIMLVSKAFNGLLNEDGMSIYGDGYIRKTIIKRELTYTDADMRNGQIRNLCKDIVGIEPVLSRWQGNKDKDAYEMKINDRLSFIALVDKLN